MSLNIKNPVTVALADELARRQGISKTAAIHQALSERLHRLGYGDGTKQRLLDELRRIRERVAQLPWTIAATRRSSALTSTEFRADNNRRVGHRPSCAMTPTPSGLGKTLVLDPVHLVPDLCPRGAHDVLGCEQRVAYDVLRITLHTVRPAGLFLLFVLDAFLEGANTLRHVSH